jgi:acyl-CoA synthetase (AMP-forming)/AMP-acid ligase II
VGGVTLKHGIAGRPMEIGCKMSARDPKTEILDYRNPEVTCVSIDRNGWLHTGDLAVLDEEGYCNITSKAKEVIRGGENICPR